MHIEPTILHQLRLHGEETYPSECCGFLIGGKGSGSIDELLRCRNLQDELHERDPQTYPRTSRRAYALSSKDIFFLDRSQRTARPVLAIYHSHNDTGAYFSAEDKAFALFAGEPAYPVDYLVLDVKSGRAREAKLFRFDAGVGDFAEIAHYAIEPLSQIPLEENR